jgi:hypothetical protein
MSLHPTDGARFLLELESSAAEGGARYRGAIFTPGERFSYVVEIDAAGEVRIGRGDGEAEPPARAVDLLRAVARSVAKEVMRGEAVWPRRVLRWKKL